MNTRRIALPNRVGDPFLWSVILLVVVLGLTLSGCDGHVLGLDCVGSSGFCNSLQPTPTNAPTLQATARAILARHPLVADPLTKEDGNNWPHDTTCNFHDGAYYANYSSRSAGTYTCVSNKISYQNVAIALNVTLFRGDAAGIVFRGTKGMNDFYEFMVSQFQYYLAVIQGNSIKGIVPMPNPAIHGMGQANRLLVIARGGSFQLFINNLFVATVQDSTLSAAGYIGVGLAYNPVGEASFSDLDIYQV